MNLVEFIQTNKAYFEDFVSRNTYHTNSIEGSTLTLGQTHALLFGDNSIQIHATPREIFEAINHKKAMSLIFDMITIENYRNDIKINLDESMIKDINETINADVLNTKGYRKVSVMIRGANQLPPAPEKVPNFMMYFIDNYNHYPVNTIEDIYTKTAHFHIEFERIHPFEDGNGRTGRLLINHELLRNDIAPIVIPIEKREEYFEFINSKNVEGLSSFIKELSQQEKERMDRMIEIDVHEKTSKLVESRILEERINGSKDKHEKNVSEKKKEPHKVQNNEER